MQSYDGFEDEPCICVIFVLSSYDRRKDIATKEDHARFICRRKGKNCSIWLLLSEKKVQLFKFCISL